MSLFLSHAGLSEVAGGVERYAHYLSKAFLRLKHVDYHSLKAELGDTSFSPLREPLRAKMLGDYVNKNFQGKETVFTNGMFCWNLKQQTQFNICHGSYSAFAEKAVPLTNPDHYRLRFLYNHYEKKAARNAIAVVANSMQTAQNAERLFGKKPAIIYPPVDLADFKAVKREKASKELGWAGVNVLFVGRPEHAKGFDLVERLALENPEMNFQCVLSRPAKPASQNLKVIGFVPHSRLPLYYSASDLVVFPSRFEGFGFVTAEALACNRKVLCLNIGIASEISHPNLVVARENPIAFSRAFKETLARDESESRGLVKERFSMKEFSSKWRELVSGA